MAAIISLLRAVNVGGHQKISMSELRALYVSLGFRDAQTFIASGNVVFTNDGKNIAALSKRIEDAIEKRFKIRPDVIVRTASELREVIAKNPFAKRHGLQPNRLLVYFLARAPGDEACKAVRKLDAAPEELHLSGRELYVYYPKGVARPKISWAALERILKTRGTGRNWNTANQLLAIAERLEQSS